MVTRGIPWDNLPERRTDDLKTRAIECDSKQELAPSEDNVFKKNTDSIIKYTS